MMQPKLHIWIGNPQSDRGLTDMRYSLRKTIPGIMSASVVFEHRPLKVSDLAGGFTRSAETKLQIDRSARKRGVECATAMIGLIGVLESPERECPQGVVYLGA